MHTRTRTALTLPALAAVTVLVLAGCAGGTQPATPTAPSTADARTGDDGPQRSEQDGPGRGGASGEIASVDGTLMQVRSADSQTAVTWTDSTTFTAEVSGALSDVSVGSCVVALAEPDDTTASDDSSNTDSSDDNSSEDASAPLAATSIRITEAGDDGTCTPSVGGADRGPGPDSRPDGAPTDAPSMPADGTRPSGDPGRLRMFGNGATGKVTAIDGDTLTVESAGPDDETTTRTVTVASGTTYTRTVAADATAVVVGQCATARGEADDSGKVTAAAVTISAPTDGSCTSGFVLDGGPGPGGPGGQDDQQGGTTNA